MSDGEKIRIFLASVNETKANESIQNEQTDD
jgi:hypothetical protein